MPALIVMHVETDAGTYVHGFHLGTQEAVARPIAEQFFNHRDPKLGTKVLSVTLVADGLSLGSFAGDGWRRWL